MSRAALETQAIDQLQIDLDEIQSVGRSVVYSGRDKDSALVRHVYRRPSIAVDTGEEDSAEDALAHRHGLLRAFFEWTVDLLRVDMCYLVFTPQDAAALGGGDAPG